MMFKNETKVKTRKRDRKIRIKESELERRETESMLLGGIFGVGATLIINLGIKIVKSNSPKETEHKGSMECLCR